MIMFSWY